MKLRHIAVTSIFLLSFISISAQSYDLRYRFTVGQDYNFYQSTQLNITQSMGPMEQEVNNSFKGITRFTPTKITADRIELKVAFETLSIQIKSLFFNVLYDSELPAEQTDNIGLMYEGVVGEEFTMVITPKGKVISVDGMQEIIDKAADRLIYASQRAVDNIKKTMQSHFGEESLKGNMEMLLSLYPETSKKVGETWQTKTKMTSSLAANLISNWSLDAASNGQWVLSSTGKISAEAEEAEMNGMKMRFNLNGTNQSKYTMSQKDGWFVKGWQQQSISGFIEMLGGSQASGNMQVPMSVTSKTEVERR